MEAFSQLTSIAAPMPQPNIDTDIIFPARFLLITEKTGLGKYAFYEWRNAAQGVEKPEFVLNRESFRHARILLAGDNFGCGSSREQAPWALRDLGFACVISTSFGEIFYANCFKNGILPVVVSAQQWTLLQKDAFAERPITVDLETQEIRLRDGGVIGFSVEPWRRAALLNGWDEIAIVLNTEAAAIAAFEKTQAAAKPWLYKGE